MSASIILTTGIYDLIKDHIRRKKVSPQQEQLLLQALKNAVQLRRRDLPADVVSVQRKVIYKDHNANQERTIILVGPKQAKPAKSKISILSDEGLAMVGAKVGQRIQWPARKGDLELEILHVEESI